MGSRSKPELLTFHETAVGTNVVGERMEEEGHMKTIRFLVFRAFLLVAFITTYLCFLYGRERGDAVPIARNVAWNDLVKQVDPSANDSPHETLGNEFVLIEKFLKEHQFEVSVRIYDIAVFRAIDQARVRLQRADKDLEAIKNELSYGGEQAKRGR
jgi:hypothetical protein